MTDRKKKTTASEKKDRSISYERAKTGMAIPERDTSVKISEKALVAVFCGFLAVMMATFLFLPKSDFSPEEKRYLAEKPKLTIKNIADGSYMTDVDVYLSDHFPGRRFFVGLDAYYALSTGRNGSNGIYRGKEGYLLTKPTEASPKLTQNLLTIRSFAETTEIPIFMMAVPSSGSIEYDLLPWNHQVYRDREILEQARETIEKPLENREKGIRWIDLLPAYDAVKNIQKEQGKDSGLYYKTDHHWTSFGAYTAYREAAAAMGFEPLEQEAFRISEYEGFYGTSYSKSAYWLTEPDVIQLWESNAIRPGDISVEISDDDREEVITSDSLFFKDRLLESDMYQVFLDGNHSLVRIENQAAPEGKLLIVKDSYGHTIAPFFDNHYREVYMVDLRYYRLKPVSELMAEKEIDQVLFVYSLDNLAADQNFIWLK